MHLAKIINKFREDMEFLCLHSLKKKILYFTFYFNFNKYIVSDLFNVL